MKIAKILLLCCAVALGFTAPDIMERLSHQDMVLDESKYCVVTTSGCVQNSVTMTLEHDNARPLVPSRMEIRWDDASSDTLMLSLEGLEMDMGVARYQLKKQANGLFVGTLLLPVCTQDKMTWLGILSDGQSEVYPAIRMER